MRRIHAIAIAVMVLCSGAATSAQNRHFGLPFVVTINGKYGFADANCRMVIPAQYSEAFDFSEGLAAVKIGQKWGYIDESGKLVISAQFAGAWYFSDGLASVKLDEQSPLWGFVDKSGLVVIRPQFGMPLWFSEGLVEGYGEKNHILNIPLGYVDHAGKYTIHLDEPGMEIEFLLGFSEGVARVSMEPKHADGSVGPSKYGYIDHNGKWIIPRLFTGADDFHEGLAAATGEDGTWGYIDKAGQFVISPRFEAAGEFSEGLAAVKVAGRWGWIDKSGNLVIEPRFVEEEVGVFRSGMAVLVHDRKVGYINTKGEMVVPQQLDGGSEFVRGVALIPDASGFAIINHSGRVTCHLDGRGQ
jgi:hypothetical protein